jgi:hypothetical protein
VHASAAFHAHTPTGPVSPAPVPALQAPVPTRRPCGFFRGRIFCPWAFCRRMFGRLLRDCRTSSRVFVVIFPGSKYHRRVWSLQKFISQKKCSFTSHTLFSSQQFLAVFCKMRLLGCNWFHVPRTAISIPCSLGARSGSWGVPCDQTVLECKGDGF